MAMRRKHLCRIQLACLAFAGLVPSVQAQTAAPSDPGPTRAWRIEPRVSVTETLTDNVRPGSGNNRADQITQISPGIRVSGEGARLKLHFDYARNELFYAQNSASHTSQNALNSFGTLEALEKWLYVDFSGVIAQQSISAFGTQSPSNVSINANQTETSSFRIAPYIRGTIGSVANYRFGYSRIATHSKSGNASDVDTSDWTAQISGSTAFRNLGWSVEASQQDAEYSSGRNNESDRLRALLSYQLTGQLKLSISAGSESNNYTTLTKESHNTNGYGIDWSPSERTQVSAFRERRFFGNGHRISISHRMPLSSWRFSDSRDISVFPSQLANVGRGTLYDLWFDQFASAEPDPVKRADLVNTFLQANNLSPNAVVTSGFLSSSASVQRRRDLSFAINGVRNTLTFTASQSESQQLGQSSGINDPFANTSVIRQRGLIVTLGHRLSALSMLNVTGSQMHSSGSSGGQDATLRTINAIFSTKIGVRTSASLGARRALFDSATNPYSENAVIGTVTAQF